MPWHKDRNEKKREILIEVQLNKKRVEGEPEDCAMVALQVAAFAENGIEKDP